MELIYVLLHILQSMAISLGVGSSTLAIVNFFVAIADGKIDPEERRMMGVVYVVLRVAMVLILITTTGILTLEYLNGGAVALTAYIVAQFTLIFVLFGNAVLMTARLMPSTVGPALQASSWYTFGIITAIAAINLANFSLLQFLFGYATIFIFAVSLVNGIMIYLKK